VVRFGSHLQDNVLFPVPHRQYVFNIPKINRTFLYDLKLLGKLSQCVASCLTSFFRITLGKMLGIPGIALAIQTFGDYARWHPHVHALVVDGLFKMFTPLEFIAATQHIPERLAQMMRYSEDPGSSWLVAEGRIKTRTTSTSKEMFGSSCRTIRGRLDRIWGDFHPCAGMIIVCGGTLLSNFGEYCLFFLIMEKMLTFPLKAMINAITN